MINLIKEINSKLKAIISELETKKSECEKVLDEVKSKIDKKIDEAKGYKVDVDKDNELAARFNVMSIPNLILFKDGKAVNQHVGFASKQDIVDFIKTALKSD